MVPAGRGQVGCSASLKHRTVTGTSKQKRMWLRRPAPSRGRKPGVWLAGSGTPVRLPGQLGCCVLPHSNRTAFYCGMSNLPPVTIYFHTLGLGDWVFCSLNVLSLDLPPAIVAFEVCSNTPLLTGLLKVPFLELCVMPTLHGALHIITPGPHCPQLPWKGQTEGFRVKDM